MAQNGAQRRTVLGNTGRGKVGEQGKKTSLQVVQLALWRPGTIQTEGMEKETVWRMWGAEL